MRTRTAGIAALVAAAGIWMSFSGAPAMAAKPAAKSSVAAADRPMVLSKFKKQRRAQATKKTRTPHARHVKKSASKASSKSVEKSVARKPAPQKLAEKDDAAKSIKPKLSPEVANAHAESFANDEARNIAALDSANVSFVNGVLVAAADQPNDSDSNQQVAQDAAPVPPPAAVAPPPPASNGKIVRAVSSSEKPVFKGDDSDPWSKTSLIGKIFIAFGSLLTLASAARLFIA